MAQAQATTEDVKNFWDRKPLISLEFDYVPGSPEYFEAHNLVRAQVEKFSYQFWQFDKQAGKKVLDIGCGPGWLVRQFAKNKVEITGVDISPRTVEIARAGLTLFNLAGTIVEGNAEQLPFADDTFDYITSAGVLHHTPDTEQAFREVYRVLKPGGTAAIGLYYRNPLVFSALFPVARLVLNALKTNVPARNGMMSAKDPDEFVRMYDGEDNPVGKAYTVEGAKQLAQGFQWLGHEVHYFPTRFIIGDKRLPHLLEKILDTVLGTMIFFRLRKPETVAGKKQCCSHDHH